jgi:hypothetical protein
MFLKEQNWGRVCPKIDDNGVMWTGLVWLRIQIGMEPSGSIKCWETIE